MKRKITIITVSIIFAVFMLAGCSAEKVFYGWLEDTEALAIKINRMNHSEVHNFLGEPKATLVGTENEVYLDCDGNGVFVYYDKYGQVTGVESEHTEITKEFFVSAETRYSVMNKLLGITREEICERYGKFNSSSKDLTEGTYKNFDDLKVTVLFDENQVAQKVEIKYRKEEEASSDGSSADSSVKKDPVALLEDIDALNRETTDMFLWDFLDLFGDSDGALEEDDCYAYFDSNKNVVFFYFDENRKVSRISKVNYADVMYKDGLTLNDEELLTLLMNEYIGHNRSDLPAPFDDTMLCYVSDNSYGHKNIYGKRVDIYFNDRNIVEKVATNIFSDDIFRYDNETVKEKLLGLTFEEVSIELGQYDCWYPKENCYGYLNRRGDGVFVYYGNNGRTNRIEIINGDDVRLNGADTYLGRLTKLMVDFTVKTENEIIEAYGEPYEEDDVYGARYKNIDGVGIRILYNENINTKVRKVLYIVVQE